MWLLPEGMPSVTHPICQVASFMDNISCIQARGIIVLSSYRFGSGCFLAPFWTMNDDASGRKPGHVVPWKTWWCDAVGFLVSPSRTAIVFSWHSVNQLLQQPHKFRGGILDQLVKTNLCLVSTWLFHWGTFNEAVHNPNNAYLSHLYWAALYCQLAAEVASAQILLEMESPMIICDFVTTREGRDKTNVLPFLLWGRQPNETEMGTKK